MDFEKAVGYTFHEDYIYDKFCLLRQRGRFQREFFDDIVIEKMDLFVVKRMGNG